MSPLSIWLKAFRHCARTIDRVLFDLVELLRLWVLILRAQLFIANVFSTLSQEYGVSAQTLGYDEERAASE